MNKLRKFFIKDSLYLITFRTEDGLPLPATPYIKTILNSILARAGEIYNVELCHYIFMSNHPHMLVRVDRPETIPGFVGYIKRESAHAINRLLGRKKKTIWCEGYDSPIILDFEDAIERIVYIYTNPQRANLVEKIEDYPHLSSWKHFLEGGGEIKAGRICRDSIPELPKKTMSLTQQVAFAKDLEEQEIGKYSMFINPDSWIECYQSSKYRSIEEINQEIISRIRVIEEELNRKRKSENKFVTGEHFLKLQTIRESHTPETRGKRMICLSSSRDLRERFISFYKDLVFPLEKAKGLWLKSPSSWLALLPPGFFAPSGFMKANFLKLQF